MTPVSGGWAPEMIYDATRGHYLIFWSSTIPGRFPETDDLTHADNVNHYDHRIYSKVQRGFLPGPPPVIFHAKHPFMYVVRDVKSGAILFMGRMVKPVE